MKLINYFFLVLFSAFTLGLSAQNSGPFLEELYDVEVEQNVIYGANATIIGVIAQQTNEALLQPLVMDVYTPVGDNNDARPLMLVFHSGNFLPFPTNNGTSGTIRDSTVVETCRRLAARGYTAAAVSYRLGWNPIDPSQDIRKFFLINAAYRGVQDCRTAIRFMRKDVVDGTNRFGIDPDKIGVWGIGTGGYIAAAHTTLNTYNEIVINKFLIDLGAGPNPMVIEGINGNLDGTSVGIVPAGYPVFPMGDTLCYPNHVNYADGTPIPSDHSFTVNMGGALGDIGWIDADNDVTPWVTYHSPDDIAAPYTTGILTVPGTGADPVDPSDDFAVVEVSGGYDIQRALNAKGTNDLFLQLSTAVTDYSVVADARNDGYEGLFPFPNNIDPTAPWDFYALDNVNAPMDPADPAIAKTYYDTIFAYMSPRACLALDLGCERITGLNEVEAAEVGLSLAPNPATAMVQVALDNEFPIVNATVFDLNGRAVRNYNNVNTNQLMVERNGLNSGLYILYLQLENGFVTQRFSFQ